MADCLRFLSLPFNAFCKFLQPLSPSWSASLILNHVDVLNGAWFSSATAQFPCDDGEQVQENRSGFDPGNNRAIENNGKSRVSQLTNSSSFDLTYTPFYSNGVSKIASLFLQQGQKGINQDAMVIIEDFASFEDIVFCGVFDGHGPHGHFVSQYVRETLPQKLQSCWASFSDSSRSSASSGDEIEGYHCFSSEESIDLVSGWKECFSKAYELMDIELSMNENINCVCSGTTAVSLVKLGNDLVLANVGDSRAVLGTTGENGSLMAVQLTVDLRPDIPSEAERILRSNGRISALRREPSVKRVWLPHHNTPGLAVSRVLGDFCLKRYGVISEPEVTHRRLTEGDKFVVLATDGVWDVLSNERVVEMVASTSSRALASKVVVDAAMEAWKRKYATSKADDCAVVCLFLDNEVASELG